MSRVQTSWRIVPFDGKAHDRTSFSCGAPELDRYIREQASQDERRDVARIFVAAVDRVDGYYTLSATSFRRESLPAAQAKRLPHYPVPAAILGRLAVDESMKGRGLGVFLLMDALDRILRATRILAVHALIVDARDDAAVAFYRKYGFIPFTEDIRRLFLPIATLRKLVEGVDTELG